MDIMPIFWAILGFVMIISEFFVPGVVIIFFGAGALVTSVVTVLIPGLSSLILPQVLLWIGFSTFSLACLRQYFKRIFQGKQITSLDHNFNDGGQTAIVIENVSPEKRGRIRYMGTSWNALSFDKEFTKGTKVWILKQEGMTYFIGEPLFPENDDKKIE